MIEAVLPMTRTTKSTFFVLFCFFLKKQWISRHIHTHREKAREGEGEIESRKTCIQKKKKNSNDLSLSLSLALYFLLYISHDQLVIFLQSPQHQQTTHTLSLLFSISHDQVVLFCMATTPTDHTYSLSLLFSLFLMIKWSFLHGHNTTHITLPVCLFNSLMP